MREDVRVEEEWLNPGGGQSRDPAKLANEIRRADQRRLRSVIVAAGRDHGNGTTVLGAVRIGVDALVQVRRCTERERPEKCHSKESGDKYASAIC